MATDAVLISKKTFPMSFNTSRLTEYKFTIPSVGTSTLSGIFRTPLDFSGKIHGLRIASSTSLDYDLSIRLIDGVTGVADTVDEVWKVININKSDLRSNIDVVFDTEQLALVNKINNSKAISYQFNEDSNEVDVVGKFNGINNFIQRNDGKTFPVVNSGGTSVVNITNSANGGENDGIFFIQSYERNRLQIMFNEIERPLVSNINDTTAVIEIYKKVTRESQLFIRINNNDAINATGSITLILQIARIF